VSRRCSPHDYRATVDDARSLFDEIESEADVAVEFDAERERHRPGRDAGGGVRED
jgi:hypothetical protein